MLESVGLSLKFLKILVQYRAMYTVGPRMLHDVALQASFEQAFTIGRNVNYTFFLWCYVL